MQIVRLKGEGGANFKWSSGDDTRNIVVNPKRTTTYQLEVFKDGFSDVDEVTIYVENCFNDSVKLNEFTLKVYPNPSNGQINMNIADAIGISNLMIYDLNGRMLHTEKINTQYSVVEKTIDLSHFPKGMYLIKVSNYEKSQVVKIILI